jgi:hypothetical protein
MTPPIIICTGTMRTGSTWSFNVCRLLAQVLAAQRHQAMGSVYLVDDELEKFVETQAASAPGFTVIKTHRVKRLAFDFIHSGKAKAVCTIRDPRDCVVSVRTFVGGDFDEIAKGVEAGLKLSSLYQKSPHTLFVRYEEMMTEPQREIRRIAAHLNMTPSEKLVRKIDQQTNLQSCRKVCGELKYRGDNEIHHSGTHRVDPLTQLHDNHIFSGESGRWRRELSSEEARSLTQLFQRWLLMLGYETPESLAAMEDVWRSVSIGLPEQFFSLTPQSPPQKQTPQPAAPAPET